MLREDQIQRYSRNILLAEIGGTGQEKLLAARVLIVGAGGLGAPLALYLAAAGIGTLGIVDDDHVELSNLQRQIAHGTGRIGSAKTASLAAAIADLNPDIRIETHATRLDATNVAALVASYDVICDGSDNFATRYLLADACVLGRRPLVSAAVLRFDGMLSVHPPEGPCIRCLHPEPPAPGSMPTCSQAGILGSVTGVLGTLQATETLKLVLGIGTSLTGRLLRWNALEARFSELRLARDPECPLCGDHPSIHDLSAHG